MMKYDFTSVMDRRGKDAIAVDLVGKPGFGPDAPLPGFDTIPMWVADMNFPVVPTIAEAMIERAKHPAFGYFQPTEEYFSSIIRWHETRNGVTGLEEKHIGYENGVLGGVVSALNTFCSRGDKVLVHSPTYIGFTSTLTGGGYEIVGKMYIPADQGTRFGVYNNNTAIEVSNYSVKFGQDAALAALDGIIGVNLYVRFLAESDDCGMDDVLRHIEYLAEVAGEDHVALGADWDGADVPEELSDISCMTKLIPALEARGYSKAFLDGLFYENAVRFLTR